MMAITIINKEIASCKHFINIVASWGQNMTSIQQLCLEVQMSLPGVNWNTSKVVIVFFYPPTGI